MPCFTTKLTGKHLRSRPRTYSFLPSWARFLNTVAASKSPSASARSALTLSPYVCGKLPSGGLPNVGETRPPSRNRRRVALDGGAVPSPPTRHQNRVFGGVG